MAQVFLTTADTSPWTVPGDFTAAGHTVELVGAGGNGAAGTTGSNPNGGGGGGGGQYTKQTYSSGTIPSTIAFAVGIGGGGSSTGSTLWESTSASPYYIAFRGDNAIGVDGGVHVTGSNPSGSPSIVYTVTTTSNGGDGGSSGKNRGGAGGGGTGGPSGAGSTASNASTTAGTTGGASDNSTVAGGSGGAGGGNTPGSPGNSGTQFDATHGTGSGGGGGGTDTVNEAGVDQHGGAGGAYGGGGGGGGGARGSGTVTGGAGADGLIVITYTAISAAITGTITPSVTEADIVTGGKTTIITLTGTTWVASGGTFDGERQNIIDGCDSNQSEANGWDAVVKATQGVSGVVRTSDTICTITWDAFASYNITANETITVTVPSTAVAAAIALVGTPTFTVTTTDVATGYGTFIVGKRNNPVLNF